MPPQKVAFSSKNQFKYSTKKHLPFKWEMWFKHFLYLIFIILNCKPIICWWQFSSIICSIPQCKDYWCVATHRSINNNTDIGPRRSNGEVLFILYWRSGALVHHSCLLRCSSSAAHGWKGPRGISVFFLAVASGDWKEFGWPGEKSEW